MDRQSTMKLMGGQEITLSSNDGAPDRRDRLAAIVGYICAKSERALRKVCGLHDHKGILTVSWKEAPTSADRDITDAAWGSTVGDGDFNVEHDEPSRLGTGEYLIHVTGLHGDGMIPTLAIDGVVVESSSDTDFLRRARIPIVPAIDSREVVPVPQAGDRVVQKLTFTWDARDFLDACGNTDVTEAVQRMIRGESARESVNVTVRAQVVCTEVKGGKYKSEVKWLSA